LHITDVLSLVKAQGETKVAARFFDHHSSKEMDWLPGEAGELSVSVSGPSESFELSLDVTEDGICHRHQELGVKKRFSALQSLLNGGGV